MRTVKRLNVKSVTRRPCNKPVHNLAVQDDESYVADSVIVHNCRSVLIPVTELDGWDGQESPEPSVQPAAGFGGTLQ
jgi:hypothetical protein